MVGFDFGFNSLDWLYCLVFICSGVLWLVDVLLFCELGCLSLRVVVLYGFVYILASMVFVLRLVCIVCFLRVYVVPFSF